MSSQGKVVSNFIWRFAERTGAHIISFLLSVILARLLDPSVYGTVALVTVFTAVLQVFVDSGLGNALIQKKDVDEIDFSSVFFFNIAVCLGLYALMFFLAPMISEFYSASELTPVIRVLSLTVVISGIKNVQQAYVSRTLQFKRFFWATLAGTLTSAVVGILLALKGFGVWALVAQHLTNLAIDTTVLWFTVRWRPVFKFSFSRLKTLLSFGWKLLASSLLDKTYSELRQLLIGKIYTPSDLAFYNRGIQFPNFIVTNVNTSIDSVLLPVMSREQDNASRVRGMTRRAIKTSTYIMAPLMIGLILLAEPAVSFVLTDKWLPCVPYLRIFCITYLFYPIHTANLNAIKAMGRSDLFLKLEVIKKIVGFILIIVTVNISVMAMAYSLIVSSVLSQIINSWPNQKLLNYTYLEQLKDIIPNILTALLMGFFVWAVTLLHLPTIIEVFIQIISGAVIYIISSKLFKIDSYEYVKQMLKSLIYRTKAT